MRFVQRYYRSRGESMLQLLGVLIIVAISISVLIPVFSLAPWVPAPRESLRKILDVASIKPGDRFYELGSGDGRVVICAAKEFGAKATGIELSLPLYIHSAFKCLLSRSQANIVFGNLFKHNLSDADVIYVYGLPHALKDRLRGKLENECKPGTRVISFMFEIEGWIPAKVQPLPGQALSRDMIVRLYVI